MRRVIRRDYPQIRVADRCGPTLLLGRCPFTRGGAGRRGDPFVPTDRPFTTTVGFFVPVTTVVGDFPGGIVVVGPMAGGGPCGTTVGTVVVDVVDRGRVVDVVVGAVVAVVVVAGGDVVVVVVVGGLPGFTGFFASNAMSRTSPSFVRTEVSPHCCTEGGTGVVAESTGR